MLLTLRRSIIAVAAAGLAAAFVRSRGNPDTPPQDGGWRELTGPELK